MDHWRLNFFFQLHLTFPKDIFSYLLTFCFFLINCSFSWNICCRISFFRNFLPNLNPSSPDWGDTVAIYFCKHSGLSLHSWIGHCEYGWLYANPSLDGEHCEGESWTIIAQHSSTCIEWCQAAGRQNTLIKKKRTYWPCQCAHCPEEVTTNESNSSNTYLDLEGASNAVYRVVLISPFTTKEHLVKRSLVSSCPEV